MEQNSNLSTLQSLDQRFVELSRQLESWTQETKKMIRSLTSSRNVDADRLDADLVKRILAKWSIPITVILYTQGPIGFTELLRELKGISRSILAKRLSDMEDAGLIQRTVLTNRPRNVRYELREKGRVLACLGGPAFEFLTMQKYAKSSAESSAVR